MDPFPNPPLILQELLTKDTDEGKLFRKNTRSLNNALTLSSLQVRIKHFDSGFAPSVIFEGKVCQRIGPLFPEAGEEPKFAQLYIHDPGTEHTRRVQNMSLPKTMTSQEVRTTTNIMAKLKQMLKEVNPVVKDLLHIWSTCSRNYIPLKIYRCFPKNMCTLGHLLTIFYIRFG